MWQHQHVFPEVTEAEGHGGQMSFQDERNPHLVGIKITHTLSTRHPLISCKQIRVNDKI